MGFAYIQNGFKHDFSPAFIVFRHVTFVSAPAIFKPYFERQKRSLLTPLSVHALNYIFRFSPR
ncbi:MAG: hypothetical protein CL587_07785 [Alteromonadaceae bacterium]|nr:hypothetical protein [Alteromonadaceae bacterium]